MPTFQGKPLAPPLTPLSKANGQPAPKKIEEPVRKEKHREPDTQALLTAASEQRVIEIRTVTGHSYVGKVFKFGLFMIELASEDGPVIIYKSAIESLRY